MHLYQHPQSTVYRGFLLQDKSEPQDMAARSSAQTRGPHSPPLSLGRDRISSGGRLLRLWSTCKLQSPHRDTQIGYVILGSSKMLPFILVVPVWS